jgi:nicotinamide riboside transporter PnuC
VWKIIPCPTFGVEGPGLSSAVEEALFKFKGADWVGMVFGLISTYYLAKEKRNGFLFGVVGGLGWVTFGFLTESIASIIANTCFIGFNCHGYFRWKKMQDERKGRGC